MIRPFCAIVRALKFLQKSMMLTPCCPSAGPTGGAGVASPAGICSFTYPVIFFAISLLDLLDLQELELHGRRTPEDRDHDLQRRAVEVDVLDDAGEIRKGAVSDPDVLSLLERVLGLGLLLRRGDAVEDLLDLLGRQRRGLLARADEPGHLRRVLHEVPRLVGHLHLDDDVAGEELTLDLAALATLHLDERLGRDADLPERVRHPHRFHALLQVLAHALLEARIRVDDEPVPGAGLRGLRFGGFEIGRSATTPAARTTLSIRQQRPEATTKPCNTEMNQATI